MAERDFSEIARLSARYNKDPKSRIFVQLADAYRKSSMIDEALEILNKGLQHHPDYGLAHLILGKCYYDKRMYEQAKDSFKKTLSLDQQNIVALRMLAQVCATTKDEQGQIDAYKGLIAIDPFDAQAKEKLDQLQALNKKEPLHTVAMAQEYEKQGDLKKALEIYEHLLYTDPTDIGLQQRVKEIKAKSQKEKQKNEQNGIEELKVETFFKPDQLEKTPSQPAQPEQPAAPAQDTGEEVMQLDDFLTSAEAESPATKEEEPLDILQPFGDAPDQPQESIDILEPTQAADILEPTQESAPSDTQPPSSIPETTPPESNIPPLKTEEPEPTTGQATPDEPKPEPAPPPLTPEEPKPEPTPPPPAPEETKPEPPPGQVTPEEKKPAPAPPLAPEEPKTEPVPTQVAPEEPKPEPAIPPLKQETADQKDAVIPPSAPPELQETETPVTEEIMDLLEPIDEKTPQPVQTKSEPEDGQEVPAETPPQQQKPAPETPTTPPPSSETTPPPSPSEQPPAETPPQQQGEKEKPKEEDFQSFQDWLSGLLK